jgi:hypothetical protein
MAPSDRLDPFEVLQAGKYETDERADWSQGDWNHDGVFNRLDLVTVLQQGHYASWAEETDALFDQLGSEDPSEKEGVLL